MNILAIETSTRLGGMALRFAGNQTQILLEEDAAHARSLLPVLSSLLNQAQGSMQKIQLLAIDIGPGSYTGLRVGIAIALTLAKAGNIPIVGISSTMVLAANAPCDQGPIGIVRNAYGNALYLALYEKQGATVREIKPVQIVAKEAASNFFPSKINLLGDGLPLLPRDCQTKFNYLPKTCWEPMPLALLTLGQAKYENFGPDEPSTIRPLYLRPSRAQIQWQR